MVSKALNLRSFIALALVTAVPGMVSAEGVSACAVNDLANCDTVAPMFIELQAPDPVLAPEKMSPVTDTPVIVGLERQFVDDFDVFQPNTGGWRHYYNHGNYPDFHSRTLQANAEQQIYVDPDFAGTTQAPLGLNPFDVSNGILGITGEQVDPAMIPNLDGFRYTSGLLSSQDSFEQTYGYFEARMKPPVGAGLWTAFWLKTHHAHTPQGKPAWPPEIDVMEFLGDREDQFYTTVHWDIMPNNQKSGSGVTNVSPGADFNIYGVLWTPDQTVFYLNRRPVRVIETKPNHHVPMFMVANLALGGNWPGMVDDAVLPARLEIDWIAAYQIAGVQ